MSDKKEKVLVAAIDIGTTFSGYAYSFKGTFETEPTKILTPLKWEGDTHLSQKTVTCVLFNEEKQFDSFGYKAESKYARFARRKEHKKCYFFKRFKMTLHDKKIDRDVMLEAANGEEMRAMTVFAESIKYMKKHLLGTLEKTTGSAVDDDRIHYVLTVPAIWSDSAKQFMREAANEAGIDGGQLTIALEPEAASLYCQMVNEQQVREGQTKDDKNISKTGTKFMVLDLGGGTIDITVYKRQENGGIAELHEPSGGYLGGTKVDFAFEQLLISLVGATVYKTFSKQEPDDHLNLLLNFERAKRTFDSTSEELTVTVPIKIGQYYQQETGEELTEAIEASPLADAVEWMNDKVIISGEKMKEMFNTCAGKLVDLVKDLMKKKDVMGTDIILMVGGFSESDFMQSAIGEHFKGLKVIVPPDTGLAVVKGAVLFGHRPISVTSRRAKYTYGINISPPFDSTTHPDSHRVSVGGHDRCRDIFKIYIHKGEDMRTGVAKSGKHISLKPDQDEMMLKIYVSDKPDPVLVDEEGCCYVRKLVVKLPKKREKIKVEVQMIFGDTEMRVEAEELGTNTKYKAYFDL